MFETLTQKITQVFDNLQKRGVLRPEDVDVALKQLRFSLLEADVALPVVEEVIQRTREFSLGAELLRSVTPVAQITKYLHEILVEMLGHETGLNLSAVPPIVVMMVGLQGSGKTTSTVKLARYLQKREDKNPLVASLDVYRPAASEQLQEFGTSHQIACLPAQIGESVVNIAKRALQVARMGGHDVLFLDMAGRNHIDNELMLELAQINKLARPQEILLVADALTGQDAVNIAQSFQERLKLTGIILTRMDGDSRGGAALSMHHVTGCPIKFIGTGEKVDALESFQPQRVAGRILGQGDLVSLVEKIQAETDADEAEKLAKKIEKGRFDLNDLATQLKQMRKMGGLSKIKDLLPGMGKTPMKNIDTEMLKRQEAIISSMTRQERKKPSMIHASRKKRIATGSGTSVQEINKLLKQFMTMSKMMKRVSGGKSLPPEMAQMLSGGNLPRQF